MLPSLKRGVFPFFKTLEKASPRHASKKEIPLTLELAAKPVIMATHKPVNAFTSPSASTAPWSVETELSKLPHPILSNPRTPIPFFHFLERLKTTKREGWRRFGISHGESIADHMYRMSIITMLAPPSLSSRLDIPRCTKMALVHDMAESLVGDITPRDGVSKVEKSRRESETMDFLTRRLLGGVDGGAQGKGMREIWQEYEDGETLEAKFVHDVDKMELVLQMMEYERVEAGKLDLGEFVWVADKIVLEEVKGWCREVLREREEFWEGREKGITGLDIGQKMLSKGV